MFIKSIRFFILSLFTFVLTAPATIALADSCDISGSRGLAQSSESLLAQSLREFQAGEDGFCWYCPIFETIFRAISSLTTNVYTALADDFIVLMGCGIAFVILFKVAKMVVQLQDVDLMQFLQDLFKPLGRAIIATNLLLLINFAGDTIFSILIQPVFDASLAVAEQVISVAVNAISPGQLNESGQIANSAINLRNCGYNAPPMTNQAFTSTELELLICWLRAVAKSFGVGMTIGATIMGYAFTSFFTRIHWILPGLIIWAVFFVQLIAFPFKLLDTMIRLAFVMALMPVWIVCWVFPATVGYTKKAWEIFLSGCLLLITLSIIVALIIAIMTEAIPNLDASGNDVGTGYGTRTALFNYLLSDKPEKAADCVSFGGKAIFVTFAMGAMCWKLLDTASILANTFISAGGDLKVASNTMTSAKTMGKAGIKIGAAGVVGAVAAARYTASKFNSGDGSGGGGGGGGPEPGGGGGGGPEPGGGGGGDPGPSGGSGDDGRDGKDGAPGDTFNSLDQGSQQAASSKADSILGSLGQAADMMKNGETENGNAQAETVFNSAGSPNEQAALRNAYDEMLKPNNHANRLTDDTRNNLLDAIAATGLVNGSLQQPTPESASLLDTSSRQSVQQEMAQKIGAMQRAGQKQDALAAHAVLDNAKSLDERRILESAMGEAFGTDRISDETKKDMIGILTMQGLANGTLRNDPEKIEQLANDKLNKISQAAYLQDGEKATALIDNEKSAQAKSVLQNAMSEAWGGEISEQTRQDLISAYGGGKMPASGDDYRTISPEHSRVAHDEKVHRIIDGMAQINSNTQNMPDARLGESARQDMTASFMTNNGLDDVLKTPKDVAAATYLGDLMHKGRITGAEAEQALNNYLSKQVKITTTTSTPKSEGILSSLSGVLGGLTGRAENNAESIARKIAKEEIQQAIHEIRRK